MLIADYHKRKGDEVEWWSPLTDKQFARVYCSSLFDFTDKSEVPKRAICGGTGFDISSRLSSEIEDCQYDYSIYPRCYASYVWFSRGCNRNCAWCVVPKKEGKWHQVNPKKLNPNGEYIVVCDNSFFDREIRWWSSVGYLQDWGMPIDFQGIDVRTINEAQCLALNGLKHHKQIKIAWDNPNDEKQIIAGIKRLCKYIKPYRLICYVLIGFDSTPEEDLYRVETLRELKIDPFVMPYDKKDKYQRKFARYVNMKAIFKKIAWDEYSARVDSREAMGQGWKSS